jgi:RNA polymerase sigma factor (TIGR02999 family)
MSREPGGQTMQATSLVHEAWLRMGGPGQAWENRAHFFGAAAEAMRRILVDRARSKASVRNGAGLERVNVDDIEIEAPIRDEDLLAVDEALERFAVHDPQKAELVKLRFFAGLTIEEAANVLGISDPTVKRYWAYSRAWLSREINRQRAVE